MTSRKWEDQGIKMNFEHQFDRHLSNSEDQVLGCLRTPVKIQAFLDDLEYSREEIYRCPLRVLRERVASCYDGALFGSAMLRRIGYPPLILEMLPNSRDDDHLLALFKKDRHWGAVGKSNFVGLRFREPVYRTVRELVMSYFDSYFNTEREKTLRSYSRPVDLRRFDATEWMTTERDVDDPIGKYLTAIPHTPLLTPAMVRALRPVDRRTYDAAMVGADPAGLYRP